jgi:hypothetical protein
MSRSAGVRLQDLQSAFLGEIDSEVLTAAMRVQQTDDKDMMVKAIRAARSSRFKACYLMILKYKERGGDMAQFTGDDADDGSASSLTRPGSRRGSMLQWIRGKFRSNTAGGSIDCSAPPTTSARSTSPLPPVTVGAYTKRA